MIFFRKNTVGRFSDSARRNRLRQVIIVLPALFVLLQSSIGAGQTNYRFTIDNIIPESDSGYRSARVKISDSAGAPVFRDRRINVHVVASHLNFPEIAHRTIVPVTIRAGNVSVTETIYFPNKTRPCETRVFIEVPGRISVNDGRAFSVNLGTSSVLGTFSSFYKSRTLLVLADDVTSQSIVSDTRTSGGVFTTTPRTGLAEENTALESLYALLNGGQTGPPGFNFGSSGVVDPIGAMAPDDIPENWIGLSGIDITLIGLSDLQRLATNDRKRMSVIQTWVDAGGFLIVFRDKDAGDDDRRNAEIARNLLAGEQPSERKQWFNMHGTELEDAGSEQPVQCRILEGTICYVPRPLKDCGVSDWEGIDRPGREFLSSQNGTSTTRGMRADWLSFIGLGKPPVASFLTLISVFLITIGPVAYSFLKRRNRVHLLLAIVPLLSLATCISVILFSMFADGFHVRGRARNFTRLDQVSGRAVSWSRTALFSGTSPGSYTVPVDSVTFPTRDQWFGETLYQRKPDEIRISGADIRARTQHELFMVRPAVVPRGITIRKIKGGAIEVTNNFEYEIKDLFVRPDDSTALFVTSNLPSGGTVRLEPEDEEYNRFKIPGLDHAIQRLTFNSRPQQDFQPGQPANLDSLGGHSAVEPLAERKIQAMFAGNFDLAPRNYLALFEQLPFESQPDDNIQFGDRVHAVHGQW